MTMSGGIGKAKPLTDFTNKQFTTTLNESYRIGITMCNILQ